MDDEKTPVDARDPFLQLSEDIRELKVYCKQAADSALVAMHEIPKLRREIAQVRLFHQWFPTLAITLAIVVRLVWLR